MIQRRASRVGLALGDSAIRRIDDEFEARGQVAKESARARTGTRVQRQRTRARAQYQRSYENEYVPVVHAKPTPSHPSLGSWQFLFQYVAPSPRSDSDVSIQLSSIVERLVAWGARVAVGVDPARPSPVPDRRPCPWPWPVPLPQAPPRTGSGTRDVMEMVHAQLRP